MKTCDIALRAKQCGDGGIFLLHSLGSAWQTDFGQSATNWRLARDERRTTRGATLLAVPVRKCRAFASNAVNVGRLVAHHAHVVCADIELSNVIAPDHQDVGLLFGVGILNCGRRCGGRGARGGSVTCATVAGEQGRQTKAASGDEAGLCRFPA